jgi:hypothetical protein
LEKVMMGSLVTGVSADEIGEAVAAGAQIGELAVVHAVQGAQGDMVLPDGVDAAEQSLQHLQGSFRQSRTRGRQRGDRLCRFGCFDVRSAPFLGPLQPYLRKFSACRYAQERNALCRNEKWISAGTI